MKITKQDKIELVQMYEKFLINGIKHAKRKHKNESKQDIHQAVLVCLKALKLACDNLIRGIKEKI